MNAAMFVVRFRFLTAASMKMTVFWDVALYSLVALMMEAVSNSKTSVSFYQTTRRNITDDSAI
jgi:hypothetical protein